MGKKIEMTATTKAFRARNPDSNKQMPIYFADEMPDLAEAASISRAVAQMPTGMEKEEEMETHLQDAIISQQACSSGLNVEARVIPTPKVHSIDENRYAKSYKLLGECSSQFLKVQAWEALEYERPEYDCDSEDENWLRSRPHILASDLEKIFEELETRSSETQICLPDTARKVIQSYDVALLDDVYDYWLAKRKDRTTSGIGTGLISKIRTEGKKDGQINPYIAFRRRIEKMQTRRNRKNDEDAYENGLRIGRDLRRAVQLADMVKRREKTKLALIESEMEILQTHVDLEEYDSVLYMQLVNVLREKFSEPFWEDVPTPRKKQRRRKAIVSIDREIPSKAWLKKNAEMWNVPLASSTAISGASSLPNGHPISASEPEEPESYFTFRPRKGCQYRKPLPLFLSPSIRNLSSLKSQNDKERQDPSTSDVDPFSQKNVVRRIGRGGRPIVERLIRFVRPQKITVPVASLPSCSKQIEEVQKQVSHVKNNLVPTRKENGPLLITRNEVTPSNSNANSSFFNRISPVFENSPSEESRSCSPVFLWHQPPPPSQSTNPTPKLPA
ncbi:unnamed protein product, partial [Mesorhabditis belari]|uniref:Enhancer of polycomb-like protein n=1 Tax=Mesorhabditis belari TaxID=2138241 RepID=A0AAF3EVX1_9BILA